MQIFRHLKDTYKLAPNVINIHLNEQLHKALAKIYTKTHLIGCFWDILHKLHLFTRQECTLYGESDDSLDKNFFSLIKKSDFRECDINKVLKGILSKLNMNCQDARYQIIFDELQKLWYRFTNYLNYTIIKKVTCIPHDKYIEYFQKISNFNSDVSLTEFTEKLIKIEDHICQKRWQEFKEISELVMKKELDDNIDFSELWKNWIIKDALLLKVLKNKQKWYISNIDKSNISQNSKESKVNQGLDDYNSQGIQKCIQLKKDSRKKQNSNEDYDFMSIKGNQFDSEDIEIKKSRNKLFDIVKTNRPSFLSN